MLHHPEIAAPVFLEKFTLSRPVIDRILSMRPQSAAQITRRIFLQLLNIVQHGHGDETTIYQAQIWVVVFVSLVDKVGVSVGAAHDLVWCWRLLVFVVRLFHNTSACNEEKQKLQYCNRQTQPGAQEFSYIIKQIT